MNITLQGFIYALLLWGIFYEWRFLLIYLCIVLVYEISAQLLQRKEQNGSRQKIGAFSWNSPSKPNCLFSFDCDYDVVNNYIENFNQKNPQHQISFTIIGLKAIGEAFKIGFNKSIKFGNNCDLSKRVCVLVAVEDSKGKNLAQITVEDPSTKNYSQIKDQLKGKVGKVKQNKDKDFNEQMNIAKIVPTFMLQIVLNISQFVSYVLEQNLKAFKIRPNNFGTVVLTNTMNFPVEKGYPPHVHCINTNFLMTLCYPSERVVVIDNKPVVKKMFSIALTFDQRIGIGQDILDAVNKIKEVFENPEKFNKSN